MASNFSGVSWVPVRFGSLGNVELGSKLDFELSRELVPVIAVFTRGEYNFLLGLCLEMG